ncbi:MAG TPA: Mut7-C RNAse domain-containing protein [Candidatus Obscuribacterales bacterium]
MKFIVDNNVGKLAVWLRALGYDTLFINPIDDTELVEIAKREERIIITKDTGVFKRRPVASGEVKAVFVESPVWKLQLAQVMRQLKLRTNKQFTRCIKCNAVLEPCPREAAKEHVPPKIFRFYDSFFKCRHCERIYWEGSHWRRMNNVLSSLSEP